jgi:hypothetical protein
MRKQIARRFEKLFLMFYIFLLFLFSSPIDVFVFIRISLNYCFHQTNRIGLHYASQCVLVAGGFGSASS